MWMHELSNIYAKDLLMEEMRGLRYDYAKIAGGMSAPDEAGRGLTYKNTKLGMEVPNLAADSLAGNVQFGNPYEQEEGLDDVPISRNKILSEIEKLMGDLNESSPTDRVALMVLGQLKQKIK
jgi:hypothetical protein